MLGSVLEEKSTKVEEVVVKQLRLAAEECSNELRAWCEAELQVVSGECFLILEDRQMHLCEGAVVKLPRYEPHHIQAIDGEVELEVLLRTQNV